MNEINPIEVHLEMQYDLHSLIRRLTNRKPSKPRYTMKKSNRSFHDEILSRSVYKDAKIITNQYLAEMNSLRNKEGKNIESPITFEIFNILMEAIETLKDI